MLKNWRANLVLGLLLLAGAVIIGRLVFLQIVNYDLYRALAKGQQGEFNSAKGDRGQIFFSGGKILATNVKAEYAYICPQEIENKEETAKKLSEILRLDEQTVYEDTLKDSLFEKLKNILSDQEIKAINDSGLAGVYLSEAPSRSYPNDQMASQVVGFVGGEDSGQYGIEGFYDDVLQGKEQFMKSSDSDSIDGSDVFLNIDYNLQFTAEKILSQAKDQLDIRGGQIIIMDPNNGRILTMAEYPGFDPNNYSEVEDFSIFQNSSIQKLFEPGSTLKPITMASALDSGKINPDTTYVDEGKLKIAGYTIENYGGRVYGKQTMTQVLEKSINTGAVFAEKQVGNENFLKYLEKFGFFKPTGIDIQGEVFSENKVLKNGYDINYVTASFGQGIEITPIQLVRAFAAIANGGKLVKPYVAEKVVDKEGNAVKTEPVISDAIISSGTVSSLTNMLVSVVENGFAKSARIPGYYVAGKTGTAQIPWSALGQDKKGYSDETWQSFIGFFPAFSPRFLVLIKLDNPKANTAEYSAAPLFKQLVKYMIDYYSIPPDYE
jgi:stage V sporulation protein D (sporulation-specific penicillin-binding protein)